MDQPYLSLFKYVHPESHFPFLFFTFLNVSLLHFHLTCVLPPQCCACGQVSSAGPTSTPTTQCLGQMLEPGARSITRTWWPSRTRRRSPISTTGCPGKKPTTGSGSARSTMSGPGSEPTRLWQRRQPTGQRENQTMESVWGRMKTVWRCTFRGSSRRANGTMRGVGRRRPLCATQVSKC